MQYTEKQAQLKNLSEINSYMNTRDNVFYTRLRDDIVKKQKRIQELKMIEQEEQNKKIYSKLLSIFKNESRSYSQIRGTVGPTSLNISTRMRKISQINRENQ